MINEEESRPIRFLLVEDDDDHAEIVIRYLKKEATELCIDRAVDGVEALEYLRGSGSSAEAPLPDVILLDLKLPKKGGHEVLSEIKSDERLSLIPVIILTTSDAEDDRLRAYRLHANSYLLKPLNGDHFRKMVQDMSVYWGTWNRGPQFIGQS
jgi:CheY-like chemotaxis protein